MKERGLEGKRILIVEDDAANLAVYGVVLKQSGAQVIQDYVNTDTINTLTRYLPVDIIVLDLMLRYGVSGYDIMAKIKAIPELADIPVLAVSASDPYMEIPKAKESGFAGFIGKPIDPFRFPDQIAACISGEEVWYIPLGNLEDFNP